MRIHERSKPFINLVEAFQTPVYTLCSLLLGEGPAAEEVAQECFTQAYVQFNQHSSTRNIQTWLLRFAYRQCISCRALSNGQSNQAAAGHSHGSNGKSASLQSLLAGLEPEDRVVIALSYWYQLEPLDIAWVMGTDGEMVKNRLRKAQKTLIAQYCQQEDLCSLDSEVSPYREYSH